jgi:hypothetical protein
MEANVYKSTARHMQARANPRKKRSVKTTPGSTGQTVRTPAEHRAHLEALDRRKRDAADAREIQRYIDKLEIFGPSEGE